jgi:hypothetical protein
VSKTVSAPKDVIAAVSTAWPPVFAYRRTKAAAPSVAVIDAPERFPASRSFGLAASLPRQVGEYIGLESVV